MSKKLRRFIGSSLILILVLLVSACTSNKEVKNIVRQSESSIKSASDLSKAGAKRVHVKVLDDLTEKNTHVKLDDKKMVTEFYSTRKVELIGENDLSIDEVVINEGLHKGHRYSYESMRTLEKGKEYVLSLIYSDSLNKYILPIYPSSIVDLKDYKIDQDPEVCLADFIARLSLDKSLNEFDLNALAKATYMKEIVEFKNPKSVKTKDQYKPLDFTLYGGDGLYEAIEIGNSQYMFPSQTRLPY